jgi:cytochrome c oxidase subunit 2
MKSQSSFLFGGFMMAGGVLRGETPMAYHQTFGPAVDRITSLGWGLAIISLLVVLIIAVLMLGGIFRKRAANSQGLAVRSDSGGVSWIYVGTGISTLVLVGCMVWTMVVTAAVSRPPKTPALTIEVTASQFWWGVRYPGSTTARSFITANEIHIPVGEPVRIELSSADVIHSFWIPQLAGKMDVIPGQTNVSWLEADKPGKYRGQCAAFCGAQHAHMALLVVAETAGAFEAWQERQLAEMNPASGESESEGRKVFQTHCAICHTIRGLSPEGIRGPDLSHLMTRGTLAAGLLLDTPGNLAAWIANPQSFKPGARMPAQILSGPELAAVTSYLNTLD